MKSKKLILVIEDEIEIRNDLKESLLLNDYEVLTAENGFEGFEKIVKYNPDMIICDVMMPVMNGHELLTLIRKNERIANIPFLFLTAKSDYDDIREGMELGADDYLVKPFDYNTLLKALNTRLEKSNLQQSIYKNKIDNIKNSIFRSIPHEIRTPLNGILNNSEWMIGNIDKLNLNELKNSIKEINADAVRLNRLFENYIFYTKIKLLIQDNEAIDEAKNSKTNLPNSIVNDICNYLFNDKNNSFVMSVRNDITILNINEHHFSKLIFELVDNAKKFSNKNSLIKIFCEFSNNKYTFKIENDGLEFPKDKIDMISEFSQFNRNSFEQSGIGLGLCICANILDIYDSKLNIETNQNKTIITFTL